MSCERCHGSVMGIPCKDVDGPPHLRPQTSSDVSKGTPVRVATAAAAELTKIQLRECTVISSQPQARLYEDIPSLRP